MVVFCSGGPKLWGRRSGERGEGETRTCEEEEEEKGRRQIGLVGHSGVPRLRDLIGAEIFCFPGGQMADLLGEKGHLFWLGKKCCFGMPEAGCPCSKKTDYSCENVCGGVIFYPDFSRSCEKIWQVRSFVQISIFFVRFVVSDFVFV